jgi:hypothetical protein
MTIQINSDELLTKQAMGKICYKQKNTYKRKLLLNVVTARIEALVSRNKFLYSCVKQVCRAWAQQRSDTFDIIVVICCKKWEYFFIVKNNFKYKKCLGNAHTALCSTFL